MPEHNNAATVQFSQLMGLLKPFWQLIMLAWLGILHHGTTAGIPRISGGVSLFFVPLVSHSVGRTDAGKNFDASRRGLFWNYRRWRGGV